ncbi:hypothetical protein EOE67_15175 [Rheinheimera riviphila]|uniref:Uncharacterized protein n=1 Tax=Rheinheimera riviphila TaxID=1834037 RepID=A0A437QJ28_9GAMM|nr:hypothetical protein [Rheinheimera riviphila]RVU34390.1 hypothetical protein EOE67_15175 [Rheinheimera riviphila]
MFLQLASIVKLDQSVSYTLQQIRAGQHITKYQTTKPADSTTTPATGSTGNTPVTNPSKPVTDPSTGKDDSTTKPKTHLDFTGMSRTQLNDWVSKAKAAGKLTSEQETAFKVLTYSSKTSSSSSSETQDNEQLNFTEKAKQGLQSAVKRRDRSAIMFWANTLSVMKNFQGEKLATTETKS